MFLQIDVIMFAGAEETGPKKGPGANIEWDITHNGGDAMNEWIKAGLALIKAAPWRKKILLMLVLLFPITVAFVASILAGLLDRGPTIATDREGGKRVGGRKMEAQTDVPDEPTAKAVDEKADEISRSLGG